MRDMILNIAIVILSAGIGNAGHRAQKALKRREWGVFDHHFDTVIIAFGGICYTVFVIGPI